MPTSPENKEQTPGAAELDEVALLRDELAAANDRLLRARADLENLRKRLQREADRRVAEARQAVVRDWLDAVDSVEIALRMEPGDPGLTAVLQQMRAILTRQGVQSIGAPGEAFDPERHEAIATQPSAEHDDRTILDVARSGFVHGDGRVLRPAQVVVSRRPAGEA